MIDKLAVVGATGNVGAEILSILAKRKFPAKNIIALASDNSNGKEVSYGFNERIIVKSLSDYNFKGTNIALFATSADISKKYCEKASKDGCICIDNSSYWRLDKDIPLIIPEVNAKEIEKYKNKNIISNPNCSTIQMVLVLKPLDDIAQIKRIVVSTYQSVSGAGKQAMDELFSSTKKIYENNFVKSVNFTKSIAFNIIPQIDIPMPDGSYKEEWKMVQETKKILNKNIEITATCVRVPVFSCHSESVNIEFINSITPNKARDVLSNSEGILVLDKSEEYIFAVPRDCAGQDEVYVSRIRKDFSVKNGLNMWIVSDNLRKGAALNAVQIAELLLEVI